MLKMMTVTFSCHDLTEVIQGTRENRSSITDIWASFVRYFMSLYCKAKTWNGVILDNAAGYLIMQWFELYLWHACKRLLGAIVYCRSSQAQWKEACLYCLLYDTFDTAEEAYIPWSPFEQNLIQNRMSFDIYWKFVTVRKISMLRL